MKGDKMLDAMEFIDADLIEGAADIKPIKAAKFLKLRLIAAAVCAIVACILLMAIPFLNTEFGSTLPEIPLPTIGEQTTLPHESTSPKTEDTALNTETPSHTLPPTKSEINFITIDVNPSLKIAVDKGLVLSCEAINDDGEQILKDINVHGMQIEMALPIVIEALIYNGYIKTDTTDPVILLSAHGGKDAYELLDKAAKISADVTALHNLSAFIITQKVDYAVTTSKLAEVYGISVGKMQYILNLLERKEYLSISELSYCPIKELFSIDLSNQPDSIAGGYNKYGEKILIVKTEEGDTTIISWDKLSPSEKKEIKDVYTSIFPDETTIPFSVYFDN